MKKRELIIAEQAIDDLMDIWLYIATDSIPNADRFIDFIHEKCSHLITHRPAPGIPSTQNPVPSTKTHKSMHAYQRESPIMDVEAIADLVRDPVGRFAPTGQAIQNMRRANRLYPDVVKVEDAADTPAAGSPLRYDKASLRLAQGEAIPPWRDADPLTRLPKSCTADRQHSRCSILDFPDSSGRSCSEGRRVRNMDVFLSSLDVTNSEFDKIAQNALKQLSILLLQSF